MRDAWRFGQRQLVIDDGIEEARLEARNDRLMRFGDGFLSGGPHLHAENGAFFSHRVARVDLDGSTVADDRNSPMLREQRQVLREVYVREHLDDGIHPVSAGELHDLVEIRRRLVVEDVIGAEFLHDAPAFVRSSGAEDANAARDGELHRGDADPAGTPWISSVSFGFTCARWKSARYAVTYGT